MEGDFDVVMGNGDKERRKTEVKGDAIRETEEERGAQKKVFE